MDTLLAARLQMTVSLAFHMIFAALGVGMPLLMLLAESRWLRTKDEAYRILAQRWAKATGITFAIGAVSGTVLALELGLLWPDFMAVAGPAIGPAFTLESFAFFIETIFLGIYLYSWNRLTPRQHRLAGIPIAIAAACSSILVTATNAWMQNPVGLAQLQAAPDTAGPAASLFANPYWPVMALHSTLACYAATAFAFAGIYAWGVLKGRRDAIHRHALRIALAVGLTAAVVMPITGHISAITTAKYQPAKLAAMEAQFVTEKGAPLRIGGIPDTDTGTVRFAITIPRGLSLLAYGRPDAEVAGLDRIPRSDWPNVPLTHATFQIMVAAGMLMLLVAALFWWVERKRRGEAFACTGLMRSLVVASPLGFIALETGWIVTEVGRQPWIIYGVMRTAEGVTPAGSVTQTFIGVVALYLVLSAALIWLLRLLASQHRAAATAAAPSFPGSTTGTGGTGTGVRL